MVPSPFLFQVSNSESPDGHIVMPKVPKAALKQIEDILFTEVPKAAKAARITEPVYCLRIWYNGTDSSEDAIPHLLLIKDSTRQKFLTKYGDDPLMLCDYLWSADEATFEGFSYDVSLPDTDLLAPYKVWYDYLCDQDEDEELQPFREMVQRVSKKLNQLDWTAMIPVTDDFVVFPADGSHTFCDDLGDLQASISPAQWKHFESKDWIPNLDDLDEDDFDDDDDE